MAPESTMLRIPNTPYAIEIWNGSTFPADLAQTICTTHKLCFPEEVPKGDTEQNTEAVVEDFEAFLDRVTFCHEPSE
eukprot:5392688-Pyramimonas_sp.AAC.1